MLAMFAAASCSSALVQAAVLFEDDFSAPTIDTANWIIHGSGVSVENSTARIDSTSFYQNGLQSQTLFSRPAAGSILSFEGRFRKDANQPRSASDLFLQDSWGPPGANRITLEFAKDQDFPGDHAIFYGVQASTGGTYYQRIGQFVPGVWTGWTIVVHDSGSDVYIDGVLKDSVAFGTFPVHINLDGSGSTAFWDDITVTSSVIASPEPSTTSLIVMGSCVFGIRRWRKRRRRSGR